MHLVCTHVSTIHLHIYNIYIYTYAPECILCLHIYAVLNATVLNAANHLVKRTSMLPYSFFLKRFSSPLEQHKVSESYDKDEF